MYSYPRRLGEYLPGSIPEPGKIDDRTLCPVPTLLGAFKVDGPCYLGIDDTIDRGPLGCRRGGLPDLPLLQA
jgi:hypothetical protein